MPHIGNFPERGFPKPLAINGAAFVPSDDTHQWTIQANLLLNRVTLEFQNFWAPVYLPQGAKITKITMYGYRDDVLATMECVLLRVDNLGDVISMGWVTADWTDGNGSGYDDTISPDTIDNENYSYGLNLKLDPNDDVQDVKFFRFVIDWQ